MSCMSSREPCGECGADARLKVDAEDVSTVKGNRPASAVAQYLILRPME